ncbi:rhomboid family intramembrane serine protease [Clostridium niameyense]|uniref:rhomboid family intramembrane serine protease n=1 Tax=Clostridium niameyense TaxID=1622073 RepID=UPI00067EDC4A|nr:rhomboid family intramembrane serine protease [Clostridium niameyense]
MSKIEKFIKNFIEKLIRVNGYNILEIELFSGIQGQWAIAKRYDNLDQIIIFSHKDIFEKLNFNYLENYFKELLKNQNVVLNIVLLTDVDKVDEIMNNINYKYLENKSIIINYKSHTILYSGSETNKTTEDIISTPPKQNLSSIYNKENNSTVITYSIIVANIIMYILTAFLSRNIFDSDIRVLIVLGAKVNYLISKGQYYRFITSMFLHGGLVHIGLNMYSLYCIGPLVESYFGKIKYLIIYFVSGMLASIFSYIFSPAISIGASGAIFGVLGATLIIAYKNKENIGKGFFKNIVSVIIANLVLGFSISNIDNFAHIGGLIGGIIISYILNRNVKV